jgi:SEL1 protein
MRILYTLAIVVVVAAAGIRADEDVITAEGKDIREDIDDEATVKPEEAKFKPPEEVHPFTEDEAVVIGQPEEEEKNSAALEDGHDLYAEALAMLNSSSSVNRKKAWDMMDEAAALGHADARVKIAWAKLTGVNFRLDLDAARKVFVDTGTAGNPEAQMGLGLLHATGTLVNSSQAEALLYYTFAAFGGSPWAQMALGYRYWSGVGVSTSCEKALDYYRRVATSVAEEVSFSGGQTLQRMRLQDEVESGSSSYSSGILDNDLIEYYQLLAEKGDVQAQVGLGQLHYQGGRGVDTDHRQAINYFQQAASAGNPVAMAFLGKMHLEGSDVVKQDNDTAFMYFKKAADQNNPVGQSGLGLMYLYGKGVQKDYKRAFDYFRKAAEQSWVDGQLQLGNMYYNGLGVNVDYKMAVKYFNLASQSGHILAFYNLADMHATGTGMLRSCPTAVELYKNVAERGKWGEMMMEAHSDYRRGRTDQALMKYLVLAELGYEVAQSNVAFIMDRKETELYDEDEMWKRALVYWTRYDFAAFSLKFAFFSSNSHCRFPDPPPRATLLPASASATTIITAGARTATLKSPPSTTALPLSSKTTRRPCSTWATCTSSATA